MTRLSWIVLSFGLLLSLLACSNPSHENVTITRVQLAKVVDRQQVFSDRVPTTITVRQNPTVLPTVDASCFGWYPEGRGFIFLLRDEQGLIDLEVPFVFTAVKPGSAVIQGMTVVFPGDYVFGERRGREVAFFKIATINPKRGVNVVMASTGRTGGCAPRS